MKRLNLAEVRYHLNNSIKIIKPICLDLHCYEEISYKGSAAYF